jgi:CubicO group peptidase (beta-lactamase class C family)
MFALHRRKLLAGVGAALSTPWMNTAAPSSELRKLAWADAGFAPDLAARLDNLVTSGRAWKLHGVAILRKGALVLERYEAERIGQLILNRGRWEGRPVVPAEWLEKSFQPHFAADEFGRYGYFWHLGDFRYGSPLNRPIPRWIGAFGYGGQRLFVLPARDIMVAISAGSHADKDQWIPPIRVIREVMLPSVL